MAGGVMGEAMARLLAGVAWVISRFVYAVLLFRHQRDPRRLLVFLATVAAIVLLLAWLL